MTQLRLVSARAEIADRIREAIADDDGLDLEVDVVEAAQQPNIVAFAKELVDDDPLVLAFDVDDDRSTLFDVAAEIDRLRGDVGLIFFTEPTPTALRAALRAGVRELLPHHASATEIAEAVNRVEDVARRRRADRQPTDGAPARRVIAVLSPKGGAGKTMLATNLAVGLARVHPSQVCLVDLDLQFGDVANALRLVNEHTILDAVRLGLHDVTALKLDLTAHPSGLYALCAPDDPGDADEISSDDVHRVIDLLSNSFPYLVVDTDPGLGEHTLAMIEQATDFVFVCATDVASVRGLNKELKALDRIGMTDARRHFVLNRSDAKVGLSVEAIADTVDLAVDVFMPSSRAVPTAMNQGTSLLEDDEVSVVTKPLWQLVREFTQAELPVDQATNRGPGFLRRS